MHHNLSWHSVAKAKVVGGCHAIDQHPGLIAPRDGLDHATIIRDRHLPSELVTARLVIETAIEAPNFRRKREALQRFIDGFA